jgi:hypothetical protein
MRGAAREGSKRARTDASSLTALPGLQFGFGRTAILCDVDVRPTPHDFFFKKNSFTAVRASAGTTGKSTDSLDYSSP